MICTKDHIVLCGCPQALADQIESAAAGLAVPWLTIIIWIATKGPMVLAIIQADLAAGKKWPQIFADLAALIASGPASGPAPTHAQVLTACGS